MMVRTAVYLSLAFLFLANAVSSESTTGEAVVRVAIGAPLTVECGLRAEQRAEWRRDGGPLPPGLRAEEEDGEARLRARLRAAAARPHHAGLYTCSPERDQRVRVLVHANPAATHAAPGEAAPSVIEVSGGDGSIRDSGDVLFDVRSNITLRCDAAAGGGAVAWQKNGTALEEVWEMKDRYTLEHGGMELHVKRAAEDDFGNYSCSLPGQSPASTWVVRARPHLKLPANSNVVEGQKLKLTCKVLGKPYPRIVWSYSNSTEDGARFEPVTGVNLSESEQGVMDGTLVLIDATRSHAGRYRCEALDAFAPAETLLRVKDKYAALWPFLGICAEVFILCAIILVYEKRRTKPDLDDSDTDNHDQKKS